MTLLLSANEKAPVECVAFADLVLRVTNRRIICEKNLKSSLYLLFQPSLLRAAKRLLDAEQRKTCVYCVRKLAFTKAFLRVVNGSRKLFHVESILSWRPTHNPKL